MKIKSLVFLLIFSLFNQAFAAWTGGKTQPGTTTINGVPDVDTPDEVTIYLVPAADSSSGNLYDEYIYANDNWEKFGSGGSTVDLSDYV